MQPPLFYGDLPFLAVRKNKNSLGFRPQCGCVTLLLFDFAHFGDVFGFAKRHAIGAHTSASKVKTATKVWQIHAPATRFAGRGPTIETCATFITYKFFHGVT